MSSLGKKLRSISGRDGQQQGFVHWCPGCENAHVIWTQNPGGPTWTWDGNTEAPTTTPSVRCFTTHDEEGELLPDNGQRTLCHYFLKAGNIEFCGDSPHKLGGQTVPLPDFPAERDD
jgi:Family of unknown function (DUF6527)